MLGIGLILLLFLIASRLSPDHGAEPGFATHPSPHKTTTPTKTTDTTAAPPVARLHPIQISSATDFDPPPQGSGDENPAQAALAIDGNPATYWSTSLYYVSADLNGTKPGVGLVLDLGSAKRVSQVKVTLIGTPTSLELRAAPATATTMPTVSAAAYPKVATLDDAGTEANFTLAKPVTTRFVLVWLTSVPKVIGGYQGKVAEIQVLG